MNQGWLQCKVKSFGLAHKLSNWDRISNQVGLERLQENAILLLPDRDIFLAHRKISYR